MQIATRKRVFVPVATQLGWLACSLAFTLSVSRTADAQGAFEPDLLNHLESETIAERFSGVLLIAQQGKPFLRAARGYADRENRIPITFDTKFPLGTLTRMFTGVATLRLVEARQMARPEPAMIRSDEDYVRLGAQIEKATGQKFKEVVRRQIFQRADMKDTDLLMDTGSIKNLAVGYRLVDKTWQPVRVPAAFASPAAGGGYSTVNDLLKFANALMTQRLLAREGKYALGFELVMHNGVRLVSQDSSAPGLNNALRIVPECGYVIIVLANQSEPAATALADYAADRLPSCAPESTTTP